MAQQQLKLVLLKSAAIGIMWPNPADSQPLYMNAWPVTNGGYTSAVIGVQARLDPYYQQHHALYYQSIAMNWVSYLTPETDPSFEEVDYIVDIKGLQAIVEGVMSISCGPMGEGHGTYVYVGQGLALRSDSQEWVSGTGYQQSAHALFCC